MSAHGGGRGSIVGMKDRPAGMSSLTEPLILQLSKILLKCSPRTVIPSQTVCCARRSVLQFWTGLCFVFPSLVFLLLGVSDVHTEANNYLL